MRRLLPIFIAAVAFSWVSAANVAFADWERTFGGPDRDDGRSVQQTTDGGYIIVGNITPVGADPGCTDVWLIKTDSLGNKLWDKTFGGPWKDEGYSVQQASDGGYIIAGSTILDGDNDTDVWLIKTDSFGNGLWDKTFAGGAYEEGRTVRQTTDGGYVVVAQTYLTATEYDVWLIKTDSLGNKLWDKTFDRDFSDDYGYSVQQTTDGGYIIVGDTWISNEPYLVGDNDIWLIKTDSSGDKLWDKTFGGTCRDYGYSVQQTTDGGYIIAGVTWLSYSFPYDGDVWLIKTDSDGNELWDRTFGGVDSQAGYSVQQTTDGGYIIVGPTYEWGDADARLIKTDSSGDMLWDRIFDCLAESVQQTCDGGYILVGNIGLDTGTSDTDVYLIKVDAEGQQQMMALNALSLGPSCTQGDNAPSQILQIWGAGGGTISYSITEDVPWLSCTPSSGTSTCEHDSIIVNYDTSQLAVGSYSGTITVASPSAGNSPQTISANLTVKDPYSIISFYPQSFSASCIPICLGPPDPMPVCLPEGLETDPPPQKFEVWNAGGGTLSYTITDNASWFSCTPSSGTSTGGRDTITLTYDTSTLYPGAYSGEITITDPNTTNSPQTIPVNLTVETWPAIAVSPGYPGLYQSCLQGQNAPSQTFEVWNSGGWTLDYIVATLIGDTWLSCTPESGSSTGEHDIITVNYNTAALRPGTYSTTIFVVPYFAWPPDMQGVNVHLTVEEWEGPVISFSPASLSPSCMSGGNAPSQTFQISNSGNGTLSYGISDNVDWLSCTPVSGTSTGERDTITVNYLTSGLPVGTYSGTITITSSVASNSPQTIPVNLTVNEKPAISFGPASLNPSSAAGGNAPSQTFGIWNSGDGTLSYKISDDVSWLSFAPVSGTSTGEPDTITVNYLTSGLPVGTYSGTITITSSVASNSPQTIPVNLTVNTPQPVISFSPASSLTPSCTQGKNAPSQTFQIWNSGEETLSYDISDDASWLSCSPVSGASTGEHDSVTVDYTTSSLAVGTYLGTITITASNAANSPQTIPVRLTVNKKPTISFSPASLNPSCTQGETAPSQTFQIWNSGSETLSYDISDNVSWLSFAPVSGTSTGEHDTVTVNYATSSFPVGTYSGTITITSPYAANSPQTIPVNLTVNEKPAISFSPASLNPSCTQGQNTPSQTFQIWNSGPGTLSYDISDDASWLSCTPVSGASTGEHDSIAVTYTTSSLAVGTYSGGITITASNAANSPQTIPVSLTVDEKPAISFDPASLNPSCVQGENAPSQTFDVWDSGGGTLSYDISEDVSWLSCTPVSGTSTGEHDSIAVTYTTSSLAVGTYSGTITITDPYAANSPQTIPVNLTISGVPVTATFTSDGSYDGTVREWSETSNAGGENNSAAAIPTALRMGDDYVSLARGECQLKAIISFDTSSIPDGATIVSATLRLTGGGRAGQNPFPTHGGLYGDIISGPFNGNPALENADFQASATATQVLTMSTPLAGQRVSSGILNASGLASINKTGITQLRLYFTLDDNNDRSSDWVGCYSGEAAEASNRPTLEVTYHE